ncbi:hypothetical protein F0L68_06330 [Solihabitans fulvus]|uniref:Uncharacterized protein n=1 Tax=Solihabitans fulvus TaxID=1892852 RepID=A0A5B2XP16_9PSEU|nr:hypothetical protein [Solihabitans fulvus]KAA2264704.1 hypothetical protein F0L68_06330 [Solihabitans fulvus]
MPMSSQYRERVRALLDPGEDLRYVFPATIARSVFPNVVVVVTDRAVRVLSTRYLDRDAPKSVWATYPVNTPLELLDVGGVPGFVLGGIDYDVDEEYLAVISAANAERSLTDAMPADPLPDL